MRVGKAGSPLPAARPTAKDGAHRVARPTELFFIRVYLCSSVVSYDLIEKEESGFSAPDLADWREVINAKTQRDKGAKICLLCLRLRVFAPLRYFFEWVRN